MGSSSSSSSGSSSDSDHHDKHSSSKHSKDKRKVKGGKSSFQTWLKMKAEQIYNPQSNQNTNATASFTAESSQPAHSQVATTEPPVTQATTPEQPTTSAKTDMEIVEVKDKTLVIRHKTIHYEIDRFCPHKQADLKDRSELDASGDGYVICLKHYFKFSLSEGGKLVQCGQKNDKWDKCKGTECNLSTTKLDW